MESGGARSLDFPPPSVLAGMLREAVGVRRGQGEFNLTSEEARQIGVVGPLLIRVGGEGASTIYAPAPRDVILMDDATNPSTVRAFRLRPDDAGLATSSLPAGLLPLRPITPLPEGKAVGGDPFWSQRRLQAWLNAPPDAASPLTGLPGDTAPALIHERRVHVGIDPLRGTAMDGRLFETDGLVFRRRTAAGFERYALLVGISGVHGEAADGLRPLGGERRLAAVSRVQAGLAWEPPALSAPRARVLLLTPALFKEGAVPATIGGAKVVAAAVGRPQTISGWAMAERGPKASGGDMAARGPKASRRMAPAGSVYWVDLEGQDPAAWAKKVHMMGICSEGQDNRDGFGLAAVGVWS
jgi:CRISPR-associated protein Cmr3